MSELKVLGPNGKVIPPEKAVRGEVPPEIGPKITPLIQIDLVESSQGTQYGLKALVPNLTIVDLCIILGKLMIVFLEKSKEGSRIIVPGGG